MNYRIDKYLSMALAITRQEAKEVIRRNEVRVNGELIRKPDHKIDSDKDKVLYRNEKVVYEPYVYYMLNKPQGVVSATKDNVYPTVLDLIKDEVHHDLFPVGRLDVDTEGLLIITNDGKLGHNLTSPAKHVNKVYEVKVDGALNREHIDQMKEGLDIGDSKPTLPACLEIINSSDKQSHALITIQEGRYHQVKRMFQAMGLHVVYLKRLQVGNLILDETLSPGSYRKLSKVEVENI
ncbi:MAG: pseudouridine synthase [Lachnospiraceae bacterium]